METRHTIGEFVFELSFDDLVAAADFEAGLHDWLRQDLLPPFEALFDSLSGPGETLSIDSLEIDLGDVAYEDLRHELPIRLLEKLKSALADCLERRQGDGVAAAGAKAGLAPKLDQSRRTDVQELLEFLASGRMTWQGSADRVAAHEHLLARIVQDDSDTLLRGIAASPHRATMVERLVRQFSAAQLQVLAERIAAPYGAIVAHLAEQVPAQVLKAFWEALIGASAEGAADDAPGFARRLAERLPNATNMDVVRGTVAERLAAASSEAERRLLASLAEALAKRETQVPPTGGLDAIVLALHERRIDAADLPLEPAEMAKLAALFIERDSAAGVGNRAALLRAVEGYGAQAQDKRKFFALVLQSLQNGQLADLDAFLRASFDADVRKSGAEDFVASPEFAATRSSRAQSRAHSQAVPADASQSRPAEDNGPLRFRLAHCLLNGDVAQLESIWHLLYRRHAALTREALLHYGKFERVQRRFALDYPDLMLRDFVELIEPRALEVVVFMVANAASLAPQASEGRRAVWDATFAFLLRDGATAFSRSALAEFLLDRLAAKAAGGKSTALLAWSNNWPAGAPDVLQLALWRMAKAGEEGHEARQDLLFARLMSHLKRRRKDAAPAAPTLTAAFDLIFTSRPALLTALLQSYRRGEAPALTAALDYKQLRRLLLAWVGLMPRTDFPARSEGMDELADFIQAIEAHALKSEDPASYLRSVLERLRLDGRLDSSAAAVANAEAELPIAAPSMSEVWAELRGKTMRPEDLASWSSEQLAMLLETALADAKPANASRRLFDEIERQSANRKQSLLAVLGRLASNTDAGVEELLGAIAGASAVDDAGPDEAEMVRHIAKAFERLAGEGARADLQQAFNLRLERSLDRYGFLRTVLARLREGHLPDFGAADSPDSDGVSPFRTNLLQVLGRRGKQSRAELLPSLLELCAASLDSLMEIGEEELLGLIDRYLEVVALADAGNRRLFIDTVTTEARRTSGGKRFLAQVLMRVLHNETVDFDELRAGATTRSSPSTPAADTRGKIGVVPQLDTSTHAAHIQEQSRTAAALAPPSARLAPGIAELRASLSREVVSTMDAGRRAAFLHAIEHHAQLAGDRRQFYKLVHDAVTNGKAVDLEFFVARSNMPMEEGNVTAVGDRHSLEADPEDWNTLGDGAMLQGESGWAQVRKALVETVIRQVTDEEQRAAFLGAIEHHAQLAGDRRVFYSLALQAVEKGEALDLEEFADRANETGGAQSTPLGDTAQVLETGALDWHAYGERGALAGDAGLAELREDLADAISRHARGEAQRAAFIHAIEHHAELAVDKRRFYSLVHEAVSRNQAVDLESCVEEAARGEQNGAHDAMPAQLRQAVEQGNVKLAEAALLEAFKHTQPPYEQVRNWFADGDVGRRLFGMLPAATAARVLSFLLGRDCVDIDRLAAMAVDAAAFVSGRVPRQSMERLKRRTPFELLLARRMTFSPHGFLDEAVAYAAQEAGVDDLALVRELVDMRLAAEAPDLRAAAAMVSGKPSAPEVAAQTEYPQEDAAPSNVDVHVENAGLVLAWPYLPALFTRLSLMENNAFLDAKAAERAVHLLQFMVTGESHTPEYALVLNKQLCGVQTGVPIIGGIDISEVERETIEGLIQAMISHWKILGNTSIAGFRESFLQRQGWLTLKEEVWHLRVQTRAYDMLLDQLPWGISMVKHLWMPRPIHVQWR